MNQKKTYQSAGVIAAITMAVTAPFVLADERPETPITKEGSRVQTQVGDLPAGGREGATIITEGERPLKGSRVQTQITRPNSKPADTDRERVTLGPDVEEKMATGYLIPEQDPRTAFIPVPDKDRGELERAGAGQELFFYNGNAYYVDGETWEIVRVVPVELQEIQ